MQPDTRDLIERIGRGEAAAENELFHLVRRCVRPTALRRVGPAEADDSVHDVFIVALSAIRSGRLRDPERLCAYIGAVFKFRSWRRWQTTSTFVASPVEALEIEGSEQTPEVAFRELEHANLLRAALSSCSPRDRDVLVRFYLNNQDREQICREMELTPTQFRLLKSRAKDRFGRIGRALLSVRPLACPASTGRYH
jgi:RNA polymerase sigma-70 factor (ECF subfamily)